MIAKRVTRTISFVGKLGILVLCLIYTIKTVGVLRRISPKNLEMPRL